MAQSSLVKKLKIQPGQRLLFLNPPSGYIESLGDLPADVEVLEQPEGKFDSVHLFVKDSAKLDKLGLAAKMAVKYDGLLWISYPKRSSKVPTDLTRDVMWALMADTGLRPVTQVSIDNVWSALRFRPVEQVGK